MHKHCSGKKQSKTYICWRAMKQRCTYEKHISYANYGGRGIKVCERWLVFTDFLSDMGEKPEGMQLDRVNVNGNYEPSNCRWATQSENLKNKRNRATIQSVAPGVSWSKGRNKWQAFLSEGCASEEQAAKLAFALKQFTREWKATH